MKELYSRLLRLEINSPVRFGSAAGAELGIVGKLANDVILKWTRNVERLVVEFPDNAKPALAETVDEALQITIAYLSRRRLLSG